MVNSRRFRETRAHHHQEAAEDYTELIYDLIESNGEARIGEIARQLGISHVTALRTIARLQKLGFVQTSKQRPVKLTPQGLRLAKYAKERHQILVNFLIWLGVPPRVAEIDAEGAEHHISRTTLSRIKAFMGKNSGRVTACPPA